MTESLMPLPAMAQTSTSVAEGVYKGRKATIDPAALQSLRSQGVSPTEIAKQLNIGRASVYRVLAG